MQLQWVRLQHQHHHHHQQQQQRRHQQQHERQQHATSTAAAAAATASHCVTKAALRLEACHTGVHIGGQSNCLHNGRCDGDGNGPLDGNICFNSAIIAAIALSPRLSRKSGNFNFTQARVLPIRFSARNERGTHSTDGMTAGQSD